MVYVFDEDVDSMELGRIALVMAMITMGFVTRAPVFAWYRLMV